MCTDIVEIWFGNANGQTSSFFDRHIMMVQSRELVGWGERVNRG